jgi:hypothetical protein
MMRKTFGLIAAGLVAALGFALTTTPAGATLAATAIEYAVIT